MLIDTVYVCEMLLVIYAIIIFKRLCQCPCSYLLSSSQLFLSLLPTLSLHVG